MHDGLDPPVKPEDDVIAQEILSLIFSDDAALVKIAVFVGGVYDDLGSLVWRRSQG